MLVTLSGIGADNNRPFLDFLAPLTQVANTLISNLLLFGAFGAITFYDPHSAKYD